MTSGGEERVVIRTPARQVRRLSLAGLVMTGLSVYLVTARPYGVLGLVLGLVGLVFFGSVTVWVLARAIRRTPVLVLDADGFTDRATLAGAGRVPWAEVRHIGEQMLRAQPYVAVTVADPAGLLGRLPAWQRPLRRLNRRLVAGDVLIPASVLPMSPAELVRTMRAMRRHANHPPSWHDDK